MPSVRHQMHHQTDPIHRYDMHRAKPTQLSTLRSTRQAAQSRPARFVSYQESVERHTEPCPLLIRPVELPQCACSCSLVTCALKKKHSKADSHASCFAGSDPRNGVLKHEAAAGVRLRRESRRCCQEDLRCRLAMPDLVTCSSVACKDLGSASCRLACLPAEHLLAALVPSWQHTSDAVMEEREKLGVLRGLQLIVPLVRRRC